MCWIDDGTNIVIFEEYSVIQLFKCSQKCEICNIGKQFLFLYLLKKIES